MNYDKLFISRPTFIEKLINLLQNKLQTNYGQKEYLQEMVLFDCLLRDKTINGKQYSFRSFMQPEQYQVSKDKENNKNQKQRFSLNDLKISKFLIYNERCAKNNRPVMQKDLQSFIYNLKLMLISYQIDGLEQQKPSLTAYFHIKSVSIFTRVDALGKCMLKFCVFKSNDMFTSLKNIYVRIDIFPEYCRTKFYKFLMNLDDVQVVIGTEFNESNCLDKQQMQFMGQKIASKLLCKKKTNYKRLIMPMSKISTITSKQKYELINQYDLNGLNFNNKESEIDNLSRNSFLTPKFKTIDVIYQCVRRTEKSFWIITIKKYNLLDYFTIQIYVPQTSRIFVTYLYPSDLWKLEPDFQENIFPYKFWRFQHFFERLNRQPSMKYIDFMEIMDKIREDPDKYFSEHNYQKSYSNLINSSHQLDSSLEDFQKEDSVQLLSRPQFNNMNYNFNQHQFNKIFQLFTVCETQNNNFITIKVWESLIENIQIENNTNGKLVLIINNYHGVIIESLYSQILNMYGNQNVHIEISLDNPIKPVKSIFSEIKSIRMIDSQNFDVYIKLNFVHQQKTTNDRVKLRKLMYTYYCQAEISLKNLMQQRKNRGIYKYEFVYADLQGIGTFCGHKLKQIYIELFKNENKKKSTQAKQFQMDQDRTSEKSLDIQTLHQKNNRQSFVIEAFKSQNMLLDDNSSQMKINNKINLNQLISANQKNYILIYRKIFTINPRQMIALFYKPINNKFYAYIWNTQNALHYKKTLSIESLLGCIPTVRDMIKMNSFLEIGKRIYLSFKNSLMISSYYILNPN